MSGCTQPVPSETTLDSELHKLKRRILHVSFCAFPGFHSSCLPGFTVPSFPSFSLEKHSDKVQTEQSTGHSAFGSRRELGIVDLRLARLGSNLRRIPALSGVTFCAPPQAGGSTWPLFLYLHLSLIWILTWFIIFTRSHVGRDQGRIRKKRSRDTDEGAAN